MIDQGNLIDSHQQVIPIYSKSDHDRSCFSQEWKSEVTAHDRSGKPDTTSWNAVQQVRPQQGDTLLDGNAQSVRYGEISHDGSGQPDSANFQEEAHSEIFVMGSDAAEFVNKVKDQVRSRQKRMPNVADSGEEHSIIWGMFMASTMNAATVMEIISQIVKIPSWIPGISPCRKCSTSQKIGERSGRGQECGQDSSGKTFMETSVIDWWWNRYQSPTRKSLRLLGFCVVSWKGSSTSWIQQSLERKDRMDRHWQKLQRLWRNQWRADRVRVEYFPRIHNVAALR